MAARTIRRRIRHGDVGGRRNEQMDISGGDALSEPLLGKYDEDTQSERYGHGSEQDILDDKEQLHWSFHFSQLIAQWAQWLGNSTISNIISGSVLGRLLPLSSIIQNGQDNTHFPICLSPLQEERLINLRKRLGIPFDGSRVDHQDALKQLWRLAYPGRELPPLKSALWKEMGWQGTDPSTDFRGGGFISLENLIFFAKNYQDSFQKLLHKTEGNRSKWEYPFAVAGINISFMLTQMLDLQSCTPNSRAGHRFLELLATDEMAFDKLFCIAFRMMDAQWLAKHASYMEFNEVLKSTRTQLERELALEDITSVQDLPAYTMLNT